jgi:hypothetical protein
MREEAEERPMMNDWMHALAKQYGDLRRSHPDERLLVVFDIDGTILDMRYMIRHVLLSYDCRHDTRHFHGLEVDDIRVHENDVDRYLESLPMPDGERERVLDWYVARRWSADSVLASHRPYRGVLDVIRWFQIQEKTFVALNTGRPEEIRGETLRSLNALGREYRVRFDSELLHMNPRRDEAGIAASKVEGLRRFRQEGFRIVAAVDNEPGNIEAMANADAGREILFLHAQTLFRSQPTATPRTVRGRDYDITRLVGEHDLPGHVQMVWHGLNDARNLRQFLGSAVRWGEADIRRDPLDRLVLRHDSFERTPWRRDEELITLDSLMDLMNRQAKSFKLDLKEGGDLIDRVLDKIRERRIEDERLWFNGDIETLGEDGFCKLLDAHPHAVIQCSVDFLAPLILAMPRMAREILAMLEGWGITRLSISWKTEAKRQVFEHLDRWGYEVNFYDVPDLEAFLQAALMLPRSLTAEFSFPAWNYFGRGARQEPGLRRGAGEKVAVPVPVAGRAAI